MENFVIFSIDHLLVEEHTITFVASNGIAHKIKQWGITVYYNCFRCMFMAGRFIPRGNTSTRIYTCIIVQSNEIDKGE